MATVEAFNTDMTEEQLNQAFSRALGDYTDAQIDAKINEEKTTREGAIAAETTARKNADAELQTAIDGKASTADVYGVGTVIAGDADLDDVRAPGRYYYGSLAAQTIAHVPRTDCGGELTVENIQNANRVRQTFVPNNATADAALFYVRMFTSSYGGAWTPWYKFTGEAVS